MSNQSHATAPGATPAPNEPPNPDLAQRIAAMSPAQRETLENIIDRLGYVSRPTTDDLEAVTVDKKLSLYILGSMAIRDNLPIDLSAVEPGNEMGNMFLYLISDMGTAIREALPWLDITEFEWLSKAKQVKLHE